MAILTLTTQHGLQEGRVGGQISASQGLQGGWSQPQRGWLKPLLANRPRLQ